MTNPPFSSIEEAIDDIRDGKMVVVCDAEDRENEGDLTMAAQFVTPDAINFMATHGRGLICLALTGDRCDELGLDLMAAKNESPFQTAFTVSIEAREGITTGISAHDRAHTVQVAIDPSSRSSLKCWAVLSVAIWIAVTGFNPWLMAWRTTRSMWPSLTSVPEWLSSVQRMKLRGSIPCSVTALICSATSYQAEPSRSIAFMPWRTRAMASAARVPSWSSSGPPAA